MTDEPNRPPGTPEPSADDARPSPLSSEATGSPADSEVTSDDTTTDSSTDPSLDASSDGSAAASTAVPVAAASAGPTFADERSGDEQATRDDSPSDGGARRRSRSAGASALGAVGRFTREIIIIVAVALIASALLRAFVVQAFFVPSGSMIPTIQVHDRILVSRIGDITRGEVVVFEDPGNWIPADEQAPAPSGIRKALEFVGVLPASGHEHLVKRVIGLPGDHVVCCVNGKLTINGVEVDESRFIKPGSKRADNVSFDVIVPAGTIFVLGDNRYVSGDSSRHPNGQEAFVPIDLVTGRAFAIIWPRDNIQVLHIPSAYDSVPDGQTPPEVGTFTQPEPGAN